MTFLPNDGSPTSRRQNLAFGTNDSNPDRPNDVSSRRGPAQDGRIETMAGRFVVLILHLPSIGHVLSARQRVL